MHACIQGLRVLDIAITFAFCVLFLPLPSYVERQSSSLRSSDVVGLVGELEFSNPPRSRPPRCRSGGPGLP